MFIEIIFACILGISLGIISGIIPGIHINLLSALVLSLSPFLLHYFSPLILACFILAIAITHTFIDVLPTTFLGIPDASNALLLFPSQKMVLQGKGYEAIFLILTGGLGSLLFSFLFLPLFFISTGILYPYLEKFVGWILLFICLFLLLREKEKIWASIIFLLSGCLGLIVFSLPLEQGLFPLFSGLFGVSMLVLSFKNTLSIPPQEETIPTLDGVYKAIPCASIIGWIASFMPGLGPAQAASIGTNFVKLDEKGYLLLIGGLSTVNMLLSLLSFYLFDKTRNGALVIVAQFLKIDFFSFLILLFVALSAGGIACFLSLFFSKKFLQVIPRLPYKTFTLSVIIFICLLVILLTGWLGFFILFVSTALGILPEVRNVAKSHMMGCLLIPVMLFFLF
ncbi:MAG: tripartite tricarboxylate transporter permease [bacterium]|nr:tripartite tricarboxylate transporter permease [bacterium]